MKFINIIIALCLFSLLNAQTNLQKLEIDYYSQQAQIDSLQKKLQTTRQKSEFLAAVISGLKAKGNLSYFEKKRLNQHLQDSEKLSTSQEEIIAGLDKLSNSIIPLKEQLFSLYSEELKQLLAQAEKARTAEEKTRLSARMQELRSKRAALLEEEIPLQAEQSAASPELKPEGTPEEIRLRAEFMREKGEKLRDNARLVEKRIVDVEREIGVRERLSEFVSDIRLFDQSDEPYARENRSASGISGSSERSPVADMAENLASNYKNNNIYQTNDFLIAFNYQKLPLQEIDDYLKLLKTEKQRLLFMADSLAKISQEFRQEADKMQ